MVYATGTLRHATFEITVYEYQFQIYLKDQGMIMEKQDNTKQGKDWRFGVL